MPGRKAVFAPNYFYHVYNRGVEKKSIFTKPRDYQRFLQIIHYYQFEGPKPKFSRLTKIGLNSFHPDPDKKLVEIICYCLMPNHFHFLLKEVRENGISKFLSLISNSYTKYFNTKYTRVGALFQGVFQAVLIESDEQLVHVSRYIHLNPVVALLVKKSEQYPWSSYIEYIHQQGYLCSTHEILNFFPSREKYKEFVEDQADYGMTLQLIKHQLIDII